MTAWIPDVVPDQLIESAWGNTIRDRTITPFANAAARDAAITTPKAGMTVWLSDHQCVSRYTGSAWTLDGKGRLGGAVVGASDNAPGANVVRMTFAFTLPTPRQVEMRTNCQWQCVTAAMVGTTSMSCGFDGDATLRFAVQLNQPVNGIAQGACHQVANLAAGAHTADVKAINASTGGTMRISSGTGRLDVYDLGG